MNVGGVCSREVNFIQKDDSLLQAGRRMSNDHVGSLVVVEVKKGGKVPIGVITDQDILIQVLDEGVSLEKVSVEDIMSPNPIVANEDEGLYEVVQMMCQKGIRRTPVVDAQGFLVGVLSFSG